MFTFSTLKKKQTTKRPTNQPTTQPNKKQKKNPPNKPKPPNKTKRPTKRKTATKTGGNAWINVFVLGTTGKQDSDPREKGKKWSAKMIPAHHMVSLQSRVQSLGASLNWEHRVENWGRSRWLGFAVRVLESVDSGTKIAVQKESESKWAQKSYRTFLESYSEYGPADLCK